MAHPARSVSTVAPRAQKLPLVKDFWMVLQSEYYLYIREGGKKGVSEFSTLPQVSPESLGRVGREAGSAAEPGSLFSARSSDLPAIRMWAISAWNLILLASVVPQ